MNKATKAIIGLVILIIIVLAIYYGVGKKQTSTTEKEPIKIGAIFDLSGPVALYGNAYKRGVELAVEEINNQGGINGKPLQIIYEDDQFDTSKAVTIVNKFINIDKISIILTSMEKISRAIVPIADQNKVIVITATVFPMGNLSKYVFRDYWDSGDQGTLLAKAANQENINKIAILGINGPDYPIFVNKFKENFKGEVVLTETYQYGELDFKTQLIKIKNSGAEGLVVYSFPHESLVVIKQFVELGMEKKIKLFGVGFHEKPVITEGKEYLKITQPINIWYPMFNDDYLPGKAFREKYKNKYKEEPMIDSGYMYDDVKILADALRICDSKGKVYDTDCISEELLKVKNYSGAAGLLSFDENGNSHRQTLLVQYINGEWKNYTIK